MNWIIYRLIDGYWEYQGGCQTLGCCNETIAARFIASNYDVDRLPLGAKWGFICISSSIKGDKIEITQEEGSFGVEITQSSQGPAYIITPCTLTI